MCVVGTSQAGGSVRVECASSVSRRGSAAIDAKDRSVSVERLLDVKQFKQARVSTTQQRQTNIIPNHSPEYF